MKSKYHFFLSFYGGALAFLIFNSAGGDPTGNENNFDSQTKIVNESPKFSMVNASIQCSKRTRFYFCS